MEEWNLLCDRTLGDAWTQLKKSLHDEAEVHLKFSNKVAASTGFYARHISISISMSLSLSLLFKEPGSGSSSWLFCLAQEATRNCPTSVLTWGLVSEDSWTA